MPEALVLLSGLSFLLANRRPLGSANPFQIYFAVWFSVFLVYSATRDTFIEPQPVFLFSILVTIAVAFALLVAFTSKKRAHWGRLPSINSISLNKRLFLGAQFATTLALGLVFVRAQALAGAASVFSGLGYIGLRSSITNDGQSFGILAYCFVPSFVLASLAIFLYRQREIGVAVLFMSLGTGLLYAYFSTGRTSILLFFCLTIIPLVIIGEIRARSLAIILFLLSVSFFYSAMMTGKGVSSEADFATNIASFADNLRGYTVAPLLALSTVFGHDLDPTFGQNSLRFFISVFYSLGLVETPPVPLIREFAYVPDATNVYTVYEVYIKDFLWIGLLIPPLFLIGHEFLYRKARIIGGVWIFYYSASVYPLLMQFFQDQYFSLMSQWIQIVFWYLLFLWNQRSTHQTELQHA